MVLWTSSLLPRHHIRKISLDDIADCNDILRYGRLRNYL